ncbi:DNA cytosine methyltransferase [Pseudogemmobacter sonorensis]|uniref:DNA cytosine methyltransferase n=1 Tax=Pseudogemmobacter sonorensis TaxID=2989681 RepID=UPI003F66B8F9
MHMHDIQFIDMFCGAGLFSAAALAAGMAPAFAIDLSSDAIATYNANVRQVGVVGSVMDERTLPRADVLIAGPPCQGFSTLGRQDPLDVRNRLSMAVPEWAHRCGARVVVIENVPPFLRSSHWQELSSALGDLGYGVQTWELEAADYGAPQYRRRSFTIGSKIGDVQLPMALNRKITAGEVLSLPIGSDDPMHTWPTPVGIAAQRIPLVPPLGDKRDIMRAAPELCPPSWKKVGCQATDVWGRVNPDEPSNTIRCAFQNPSKGRYLHPTEDRVLSLREGARLQGVPDSWTFVGRPYPVARQIGNGVPVALGSAVMRSVVDAIRHEAVASTSVAA